MHKLNTNVGPVGNVPPLVENLLNLGVAVLFYRVGGDKRVDDDQVNLFGNGLGNNQFNHRRHDFHPAPIVVSLKNDKALLATNVEKQTVSHFLLRNTEVIHRGDER